MARPLPRDVPSLRASLRAGAEVRHVRNGEAVTGARHSSESSEHYSPHRIVEAARATLGAIDLDPASCDEANGWIGAARIFCRDDDGFIKPWTGRVFLNPPGGLSDDQQRPVRIRCRATGSCGLSIPHAHDGVMSNQKKWWFKAAREFHAGSVSAAVFVCFSVELLQSTQSKTPAGLPIPLDFPICYPAKRVAYVKPGGSIGAAPPHASCIVYMGDDADRFRDRFGPIGRVTVPGSPWVKQFAEAT